MNSQLPVAAYIVNEDFLVEHIMKEKSEDVPGFVVAYNEGQVYKSANMTPIYMVDSDFRNIWVVAAETYNRKLH